ncbi:MAG TPA: roadblock/LC7 domain-containing protein, partial [Deinococcales bacterium]|nr:roadblock/LC7 domain-containing protein [Deinococcales bacterium]
MGELEDIMAALAEQVDGAVAAAIGGMDGLLIEQTGSVRQDLSGFIAEVTNVLSAGGTAMADRLGSGNLE